MNGALAFVDTSDCTLMNIAEHYMASDVEWDPTGRYVVTSVSWWSHKVRLDSAPHHTYNREEATLLSQPSFSAHLGGQRILGVDIPGSTPSEKQQGPLLSAAVETPTSHSAQC